MTLARTGKATPSRVTRTAAAICHRWFIRPLPLLQSKQLSTISYPERRLRSDDARASRPQSLWAPADGKSVKLFNALSLWVFSADGGEMLRKASTIKLNEACVQERFSWWLSLSAKQKHSFPSVTSLLPHFILLPLRQSDKFPWVQLGSCLITS